VGLAQRKPSLLLFPFVLSFLCEPRAKFSPPPTLPSLFWVVRTPPLRLAFAIPHVLFLRNLFPRLLPQPHVPVNLPLSPEDLSVILSLPPLPPCEIFFSLNRGSPSAASLFLKRRKKPSFLFFARLLSRNACLFLSSKSRPSTFPSPVRRSKREPFPSRNVTLFVLRVTVGFAFFPLFLGRIICSELLAPAIVPQFSFFFPP